MKGVTGEQGPLLIKGYSMKVLFNQVVHVNFTHREFMAVSW